MTAERKLNFGMPEIDWPTEVSVDDIERIKRERKAGKSLAASVSLNIINEAITIATGSYKKQSAPLSVYELISAAITDTRRSSIAATYASCATIVLDAEQAIRGEVSISAEIIAKIAGQPLKFPNVNEVFPFEVAREAGWELRRDQYRTVLIEKGPSKLVDLYCNARIKGNPYLQLNPRSEEAYRLAFEKGRLRFHQLYRSATEMSL